MEPIFAGTPDTQTGRLRAHDILVMFTSGLLSRAVAIGLGDQSPLADAADHLCHMWTHLLERVTKPEV